MRRARSTILSALLFVFSFFVIHDFVMVNVDADTQFELCYAEHDESVLDLPSQIHDHIHVLQAAPDIENTLSPLLSPSRLPLFFQESLCSNTLSVPQRPPLS